MKQNKMSKVLFIVHDLYQEDNHFPLGIAYLSAVLKKAGHEIDVVSQDIYHFSTAEVCSIVKKTEPDFIGIGFLSARFKETVLPLCKAINEVKGSGKLILGGHGATGSPKFIMNKTNCDHVIVGEGENTIINLVNGETGVESEPVKELDSLPLPDWDSFPVHRYMRNLKMPGWEPGDYTMPVIASRGCVGKCTFCHRLSKGLRFRAMESVVHEIKELYRYYGINYIFFQDEMFVSSKKRMVEFHEELDKAGLLGKIKWGGDSRVDVIDREMLEILKSTNVQFLDYGFESMDEKVLKLMNKKTTPSQNYACADLTRKAGIPFNMNILWGMPGDSTESLRKNISFINEFNTYSFLRTIRPPTPYPGCELFDSAVKEKKLDGPEDFYGRFSNSDRITVNFTDMPDEEFYMNLYWANALLIRKYFDKKGQDLTADFYKLYFENGKSKEKFRGARHYD